VGIVFDDCRIRDATQDLSDGNPIVRQLVVAMLRNPQLACGHETPYDFQRFTHIELPVIV